MEDMEDGDRPRKRVNTGPTRSRDPIDFLSPTSPEVRAPGQRHTGPNTSLSSISLSSDESPLDPREVAHSPAGSRIVRRPPPPSFEGKPPSSSSTQGADDDARFTRFRLTQIEHDPDAIRAAWKEAAGDVPKASALLNNPSWKPPVQVSPPKTLEPVGETGRVKEVVEANKAQRLAVKEKGKKSIIYRNRTTDGKPLSDAVPATPTPVKPLKVVMYSPMSPELMRPKKRLKRKVVDSDSEGEYTGSDEDSGDNMERASMDEQRALDYFNETSAEGLQELTGASFHIPLVCLADPTSRRMHAYTGSKDH